MENKKYTKVKNTDDPDLQFGDSKLQFLHITKNAGSTIESIGAHNNIKWGKHNHELHWFIYSHTESLSDMYMCYNLSHKINSGSQIDFEHFLDTGNVTTRGFDFKEHHVETLRDVSRALNEGSIKLNDTYGIVDYLSEYHNFDKTLVVWAPWHLPISNIPDESIHELTERYDFFCVVRDPYDRVVSEYYCPHNPRHAGLSRNQINTTDVHTFNNNLTIMLREIDTVFTHNKQHQLTHWQLQSSYFMKNNNLMLPETNILRFENLESELPELLQKYDIDYTPNVHENKSKKIFCSKDINEKNIKMINRIYSEDFINCGYKIKNEKDDEK